jgi:hypothetical protein
MVVNNFNDFLLEKEMINWQKLYEEAYWEDLTNKIFSQLDDAFKKGEKVFIEVVRRIVRYFKTNPKMLLVIFGVLVMKYHFTKSDISDVLPEGSTISAEEIYAKSREGKGLPEDEYEDDSETDTESEDGSKIVKFFKPVGGNFIKFLNAMAGKESTNNPDTVNSLGYMGKYQFGEVALKDILKKHSGESDEDYKQRIESYWPSNFGMIKNNKDYKYFLSKFKNKGSKFWSGKKQDLAMKQLLKNNKSYLGDYLDKWVGKTKKGIKITQSGLLAGAHLLGPYNVKRFLDTGHISRDANGTPITEYIEKFGGYQLPL